MFGVVPAKYHKASLDVERYALKISISMRNNMFVSVCTLMYLRLFFSNLSSSKETGAPYSKIGRIAPF